MMEHPILLALLQEHLPRQSTSRVDSASPVKIVRLQPDNELEQPHHPQCYIQLQVMNLLKPNKLAAADHLTLHFLQSLDIETANKTALVVANNPEFEHTLARASVVRIRYHSLIGTNVKSAGTHTTGITRPRSQEVSPLSNSNIVSGSCDHTGGTITSEDGIKLTIPEGAIKDGDLVTFSISSELYGPFLLPSKCQAA